MTLWLGYRGQPQSQSYWLIEWLSDWVVARQIAMISCQKTTFASWLCRSPKGHNVGTKWVIHLTIFLASKNLNKNPEFLLFWRSTDIGCLSQNKSSCTFERTRVGVPIVSTDGWKSSGVILQANSHDSKSNHFSSTQRSDFMKEAPQNCSALLQNYYVFLLLHS